MSSHLTERQIAAYRDRVLPPRELLEVDDHLAVCADCRLRLAEGEPLAAAFAAWNGLPEEPAHRVALDLDKLGEEAAARPERQERPARPAVPVLWAAALLLAVGLLVWFLLRLPAEDDSLRADPRRMEASEGSVLASLSTLPEVQRHEVAAVLRAGRLERPPEIVGLLGAGAILRGKAAATEIRPLSPLGTAVRDGRPTFRWSPLAGAESYRVTVFDRDFHPVAAGVPDSRTEWTPEVPLAAGTVYAWQVKARRGEQEVTAPGPGSPQALFRVLPEERWAAVEDAAGQVRGSRLALGVLYARAGLVDDAERELQAAVQEHPGSAEVRSLLASVRSWRQPTPQPPSPTSTNPAQ
jgi:hypothetical protein